MGAAFVATYTDLVTLLRAAFDAHASRDVFAVEENGAWKRVGYAAVGARAAHCAAFLAQSGVGPGDVVAIISGNRPEWLAVAFGALRVGAAVVPMYEAQLEKDWKYVLRDAGAKVCFCATADARAKIEAMKPELPALVHVSGFELDSTDAPPPPWHAPAESDIAFLIYTSGTTGNPKGVELSHGALAFVACSLNRAIPFSVGGHGGRTVSILPWAHVGGLMELIASLEVGMTIAVISGVDRIMPAIQATKPTILVGVPRVWNKLYDAIQKKMAAAPLPIRLLFERGIAAATKKRAGERLGRRERAVLALAERVLFPKVRAALGGELEYAISGAAALSVDVARFIAALGIELLEVYGLSEVSSIATANRPGASRLGTVGPAIPGVELRIDGEGEGGGEVLIKTPGRMRGYRGLDEETRAVLDGEWLRSGDLGRLDADGFLTITGRVREVYKLENGKFVSPAPIEEKLATSRFISQAMVHGLNRPFNVALLVADIAVLRSAVDGALAPEALLAHHKTRELIAADVRALCKEFKSYERVERFHLVAEELSLANEMLTPTMKVKRRKVLERWGKDLERLYE